MDASVLLNIFSFVYSSQPLSLSPFSVCKQWNEVLTASSSSLFSSSGPLSSSSSSLSSSSSSLSSSFSSTFWKQLFHAKFPNFFSHPSPSKKRSLNAVSIDYRYLYLYTCSILQVDSSLANPVLNKYELEDQLEQHIGVTQDATRYRRELMEAVAFRFFSGRFPQFVSYTHHHLLYGPVGCGKTTLIESLARLWGSHIVTIQFPKLVKLEERLGWPGYVDYLYNYVLAFAKSHVPTIIHLHDLNKAGSSRTQQSLTNLLECIPLTNVWVIGTTTDPVNMNVAHAKYLTTKLYVPFPTAAERETFLKSQLFQASQAPKQTSAFFGEDPEILPMIASQPPVSADSIHLLALHTHDFTYTDMKNLCQKLHDDFYPTYYKEQTSIPFVKLMHVLSKVVSMYKPEDAKKFEDFDPGVLNALYVQNVAQRTVI